MDRDDSIISAEVGMDRECGNGITAGCASHQGWRPTMEDEHAMHPTIPTIPGFSLFCVFDGHGGKYAAKYCKTQLPENLFTALRKDDAYKSSSLEQLQSIITTCVFATDNQLRTAQQAKQVTDQKRGGYPERSGCTAVFALITPTDIIVANIGDSRVALSSGGKTVAMSEDHKPLDVKELKRIQNAGSNVIGGRVDKDLNLSRSMGDFRFKNYGTSRPFPKFEPDADYDPKLQPISAEPDFQVIARNPAEDEFLFIACDGIWDVMSTQIAGKYVRNVIKDKTVTAACQKVNEECLSLSSLDNMTSMIVLFDESAASGVEVRNNMTVDPSKSARSKCDPNESRMC